MKPHPATVNATATRPWATRSNDGPTNSGFDASLGEIARSLDHGSRVDAKATTAINDTNAIVRPTTNFGTESPRWSRTSGAHAAAAKRSATSSRPSIVVQT